jgi:hypothetical protein
MAFAFWRSTLLLAADEIGLFALLAHTPADAASVAERLGLCPSDATDYLEALATLGLVECRDGVHCNTPMTERFLVPGRPDYLGHPLAMARAAHREAHRIAESLHDAAASRSACQTLRERMWSDIAAIMDETGSDSLP